jgi:hypothetical protein
MISMSISNEIQSLDHLRRSCALTQEEFELAKQKVLRSPLSDETTFHAKVIKIQYALLQLELERENDPKMNVTRSHYGQRYTPSYMHATVGGVLTIGAGCLWTIVAFMFAQQNSSNPLFELLPILGVLIIIGAYMSFKGVTNTVYLLDAQELYPQRRLELLNRLPKPKSWEVPAEFDRQMFEIFVKCAQQQLVDSPK